VRAADLRAAALWVVAIVPQAFGFWLVAGDLAGVPASRTPELVLAALLTLGAATLGQVLLGYRMSVYEGPAASYLAALAIVGTGTAAGLPALTGGLIVAGTAIAVLGVLRLDLLLRPLFTPVVATVFVAVVTSAVLPSSASRAIAAGDGHPLGTAAGWAGAAAVLAAGLGLQRVRALRPYALAVALGLGALVAAALGGGRPLDLRGGIAVPEVLPWGAPDIGVAVVVPFLIAGLVAAFNTIAAIEVAAAEGIGHPDDGAGRRALIVHGAAQVGGALWGNLLGTVARLDSIPIIRILGDARSLALALAAVAIFALAFVEPVLGLVAALPLSVSAAVLTLMLSMLLVSSLLRAWTYGPRIRWFVVAPSLVPSVVWVPLSPSLSETGRLLANPLVWGVVLGIVLERLVAPGRPPLAAPA
jgi:xanthine/uracil permease